MKSTGTMTIHFFTKGDKTAGSSRQRAFLVADELNKRGMKAIVHQPPTALVSEKPWPVKIRLIWQYLMIFGQVKKSDIVYLQRTIYNKYFFVLLISFRLIFRRKMIFDFDDAIYMHSPFKTGVLSKCADVVFVGSHSLAEWANKHNKDVYIVPTCVSSSLYAKYSRVRRIPSGGFVIGWIGNGPVHLENLEILRPVFKALIDRKIRFKFRLVGSLGSDKIKSLFNEVTGLDVEYIDALDWSDSEAVPKTIRDFDIGLMPLIDTEWNRGKCAFKAVEYMACGVPAVISPVGENNYLVQDGVNGFLADSTEEWASKIERLYNDPGLLSGIGKKAQETIKERYSYESVVPFIVSVLNKL